MRVPEHIAIILDGNGRWAKKRLMPRNYGHMQGSKAVELVCEEAYNIGVKYLTVYAFSTENWQRPSDEVQAIMKLLRNYLKDCIKTTSKNNMKVRILGDKAGLDDDIREQIDKLEKESSKNTGLNFQIAINYGSRDEMVRAMRRMSADIASGIIKESDITEETFSSYLDTRGIPDPDMIIRTSGEQRLSNFLMWQSAYSEFYFPEVLWPDFNRKELVKAIEAYNKRDRRYGKVKEK
ncbi:MAG: isoprenyl transferase [Lachnospiraceae bacterium]|uniref:isoprenyl transferase n=1 Tax=Falcatimonas sp. MSJ-15 TaxID=2841515 RepID=UPI001C117DDA|nr:isoprenyl transferase [Lachnospiraceae bacterium]MBU5469626.1 isoprenyl transferase [Falcatimonas sp. MSJ-15]